MRRLFITVSTGSKDCPDMVVYRDVRDEDLAHDYSLIVSFPNVVSVTVEQKKGESWPDFVKLTNSLIGPEESTPSA